MSVCLTVRPSVRTPFQFSFLPSDFQNSFFVWKVSHQRPNFYNFRPFIRPSVPHSPFNFRSVPPFNFRSNRKISQIIFLFERYNIRDLALYFLSVCPYSLSPSVLTIRISTTKQTTTTKKPRKIGYFSSFRNSC